jgi:anti-anti-sigma regulatory factor
MDSAGIALLLRVAARVDAVEIRNPSVVMRRIIESTGLSGVFHITG